MRIHPARLVSQCPACRHEFQETNFVFLGEESATQWFHCACEQCGQLMIAFVLEMGGLVSSIGMSTDASAKDAQRFLPWSGIEDDECIAFHEQLETQSQDWCQRLKIPLT